MSNNHADLTDDQIHNPKGFVAAANESLPTKNSSGALEWILKSAISATVWEAGVGTGAGQQAGGDNSATTEDSLAMGKKAGTWLNDMQAWSSGEGVSGKYGSSQGFRIHIFNFTTGDAIADLLIEGTDNIDVPIDSSMFIKGMVIGVANRDGGGLTTGETICFSFDFTIKNVAGTTAIVGDVTFNLVGDSTFTSPTRVEQGYGGVPYRDSDTNIATAQLAVTADNTNDCIKITVTGILDSEISWSGILEGVMIAHTNFDINPA